MGCSCSRAASSAGATTLANGQKSADDYPSCGLAQCYRHKGNKSCRFRVARHCYGRGIDGRRGALRRQGLEAGSWKWRNCRKLEAGSGGTGRDRSSCVVHCDTGGWPPGGGLDVLVLTKFKLTIGNGLHTRHLASLRRSHLGTERPALCIAHWCLDQNAQTSAQ